MKNVYILEDNNGVVDTVFSSLTKALNVCFTESTIYSVDHGAEIGPDAARKQVQRDGYISFDGHEYKAIQRMPLL